MTEDCVDLYAVWAEEIIDWWRVNYESQEKASPPEEYRKLGEKLRKDVEIIVNENFCNDCNHKRRCE